MSTRKNRTSFGRVRTIKIVWEETQSIKCTRNDEYTFTKKMKDSIGEYEFAMAADGPDHVLVSVEGTPYSNSRMTRAQAAWEWDMIWNTEGWPRLLAAHKPAA